MKTTNTGSTPILYDITIYYIYCNAPDVTFVGESSGDRFGYSVHGAGDINDPGDGYDDIIVGAPFYGSGRGAVYVFNGSATISGTISAASADYVNYSYDDGSHFGWSVCKAGDLNNDGTNDVAIGAPDFDTTNAAAGKGWIMSIIIIPEFTNMLLVLFVPAVPGLMLVRRKRRNRREENGP